MNCLNFSCNINITDNVLDLNIDDFLEIAVRNNNKRRFLFVSKPLGKHLACRAEDMDSLGELIVKSYQNKGIKSSNGTIISFAETGTAIGHSVFEYLDGDYEFIHTTREVVDGFESLEFLEEHSHATDHKLYFENLERLKKGEEIILVDDEITTAKTCINLIKKIHSKYPKKRYTICSILNWVEDENLLKINELKIELNCIIDFVYLFKGNFEFNIDESSINIIQDKSKVNNEDKLHSLDKELDINYINLDMEDYISSKKYIKYTGRFGIDKCNQNKLKEIVKRESKKIEIEDKNSETLFLGTEEFMYIPMLFAKECQGNIYYHSITRSPIININRKDYPIKSKFELHSFYNSDIKNYLYNLDQKNYSECFLFVELNKDKIEYSEIINIFKSTSIKKLNIVCCS